LGRKSWVIAVPTHGRIRGAYIKKIGMERSLVQEL
jgi:hypothetical protein